MRTSNTTISDVYSLNKTGMLVGAYEGTTYSTFVKTQLSAATYVSFTATNLQYQSVLDGNVHALIGDAIQFYTWLKSNNATCSSCYIKLYGEAYSFGTFTTGNITARTNGANHVMSCGVLLALFAMILSFNMI